MAKPKPIRRSAWRDWLQVLLDLPLLMLPALVLMAARFGSPHWWI